eukprot:6995156-Pyramimonas_sp.AAC.1
MCDIVLIDGDHTKVGAIADILNFAKVARCNTTLLIDDIHTGPGLALQDKSVQGLLEIDEWNMYDKGDMSNPCLRVPPWSKKHVPGFHGVLGGHTCLAKWGWARGRYVHACV